MPHSDYTLPALLRVFARAYVAGFTLGFCPPVGLFLMRKCGLIDSRGAGR